MFVHLRSWKANCYGFFFLQGSTTQVHVGAFVTHAWYGGTWEVINIPRQGVLEIQDLSTLLKRMATVGEVYLL